MACATMKKLFPSLDSFSGFAMPQCALLRMRPWRNTFMADSNCLCGTTTVYEFARCQAGP